MTMSHDRDWADAAGTPKTVQARPNRPARSEEPCFAIRMTDHRVVDESCYPPIWQDTGDWGIRRRLPNRATHDFARQSAQARRLLSTPLAVVFQSRDEKADGSDDAVQRQSAVGEAGMPNPGHGNCHGEICRRLKIEHA